MKTNFSRPYSQKSRLTSRSASVFGRKQPSGNILAGMVFEMLKPCGMILRSESGPAAVAIRNLSSATGSYRPTRPGIGLGASVTSLAYEPTLAAATVGGASYLRRFDGSGRAKKNGNKAQSSRPPQADPSECAAKRL